MDSIPNSGVFNGIGNRCWLLALFQALQISGITNVPIEQILQIAEQIHGYRHGEQLTSHQMIEIVRVLSGICRKLIKVMIFQSDGTPIEPDDISQQYDHTICIINDGSDHGGHYMAVAEHSIEGAMQSIIALYTDLQKYTGRPDSNQELALSDEELTAFISSTKEINYTGRPDFNQELALSNEELTAFISSTKEIDYTGHHEFNKDFSVDFFIIDIIQQMASMTIPVTEREVQDIMAITGPNSEVIIDHLMSIYSDRAGFTQIDPKEKLALDVHKCILDLGFDYISLEDIKKEISMTSRTDIAWFIGKLI